MALYLKNLPGRMLNKFSSFFSTNKDWQDIEYFDDSWKDRIAYMAKFINQGSSVMDLGCGKMWLNDYIPANSKYIPVDYCIRSPQTIIANFNKNEFPLVYADVLFISGCLEYLISPDWFFEQVSKKAIHRIILSYCTLEIYHDLKKRKKQMWKNNLTTDYIESAFQSYGFSIVHKSIFNNNTIFVFDKM